MQYVKKTMPRCQLGNKNLCKTCSVIIFIRHEWYMERKTKYDANGSNTDEVLYILQ